MEHALGNIFIRPNLLVKAGDCIPGHRHNFDHTTLVATGALNCKRFRMLFHENGSPMLDNDGKQAWLLVDNRDFVRGEYFLIKAEERHDITALEDNTKFLCIYAHRTPQGDIVQSYTGWGKAYSSLTVERQ